ncbi:MAG TPA: 50S ribosomal protein L11 methyltransferase [Gemmatimonadales bacterium]|nr:50S ribosomal protein L11 methyltransferase [Gemmatimonadales bacterium]
MTWWAVDVQTAPERRGAVCTWLVARTGHAVEERDDGVMVAFAADESTAVRLAAEVGAETGAAGASWRALDVVDWSTRWREGLGVRQIGRLTVSPSWLAAAASAPSARGLNGERPLVVIDPESAFGSGEHGSTRSALALLDRHLDPGARVLDLGSGSGILAIASAVLGAASAIGIDCDPDANEVAERNAARNGVAGRTRFVEGDAGDLAPLLGPADLIVANILRTANVALLPAVSAALAPGGSPRAGLAIFAGMEACEAELFRPALAERGFRAEAEVTDAGWWAVAARLA